jgi:glycosyltransferase involved in cell wall biosynthesis
MHLTNNINAQWSILAGLRFFLAWVVVCDHLRHCVPSNDLLVSFKSFTGFSAVLGFLLISGYSIACSISKGSTGFYRRRFMRVYPLYLIAIFVSFIPFLIAGNEIVVLDSTKYQQPTLINLIGNLFFFQGFLVFPLGSNGVIWTLSVEVACYLLAPLLVKLKPQIFLLLITISAGCYLAFSQIALPNKDITFLRYGLPLLLLSWAWLLGFFYFFHAKEPLAKISIVLLGCFLLGFHGGNYGSLASFTYALSALLLIYAPEIALPQNLCNVLDYLGELSYPLYLFHTPAILLGYAVMGLKNSFSLIFLSLIFSALFYYLVDLPLRHKRGLGERVRESSLLPSTHQPINLSTMKIAIVRREKGVALSMDVYTDNLIDRLKQLQPTWEIIEIAPTPWGKNGDENLWKSGTGVRKYYERLWNHPRQVSQIEADIYHIVDHSNAHVAYWLKKTGKPIVVTCHDLVQFVYPEILNDRSRFPALSMASWKYSVRGMKSADRVIAVSNHTAKDVHQMLAIPLDRIDVVPNGVEPYFRPLSPVEVAAIRQRYEGSSEALCLLNVGSTHQRKNIPTILKVLVMLRECGVAVKLWKVGDEFTAEQNTFIQSHNLESTITFMGKPDKTALREIYNAADVLLAPSLYEGFGLTILEAMACGLPVITANVSSLPEVVGDGAIQLEPMDVSGIVEKIRYLQQNLDSRNELIERGLIRAKAFCWSNSAEKVGLVYERAVQQKTIYK